MPTTPERRGSCGGASNPQAGPHRYCADPSCRQPYIDDVGGRLNHKMIRGHPPVALRPASEREVERGLV